MTESREALAAFHGVVALELSLDATPSALIDRSSAQVLAQAIAAELQRHLSSLEGLGLVWMAAAFDAAQLLRPGFPVFRELKELYRVAVRDPLREPQVLTLSALRGEAPSPALQPELNLFGSLLHLPFAVIGAPALVASAAEILERDLMEQGLVDARMARSLVDALECKLEHARLLSLDDLAALTAANLQHAGMALAWDVIEHALFHRQRSTSWEQGGLRLRWWPEAAPEAELEVQLPELAEALAPEAETAAGLAAALELLRSCHALWRAHGINGRWCGNNAPVAIDPDAGYWLEPVGSEQAWDAARLVPAVVPGCYRLERDGRTLGYGAALTREGLTRLRERFATSQV